MTLDCLRPLSDNGHIQPLCCQALYGNGRQLELKTIITFPWGHIPPTMGDIESLNVQINL